MSSSMLSLVVPFGIAMPADEDVQPFFVVRCGVLATVGVL